MFALRSSYSGGRNLLSFSSLKTLVGVERMESTGGSDSFSDWERPFTDLELQAIEAAFQSATTTTTTTTTTTSSSSSSPTKRRRRSQTLNDDSVLVRRRLPASIDGAYSSSLLPCRNKRFFNAHRRRSSPAKLEMRYPAMAFTGQVVYSRTFAEVEKAAKEILNIVETRKRGVDQVILGLDIEWRPIFRKGVPPRKVAVMQLCGDPCHCYVMHIFHSGIPQSLQSLLEDPTSVKVGVGIGGDAGKVYKDYNISIKALEDLSGLANQKFGGVPKRWSMASLTEKLICKQLPKPGKIRLGNWEADTLSAEQLQYAATDAFASWYLYQSLKTLPNATDNTTEEIGKCAEQ